jgi:hypothetical protein
LKKIELNRRQVDGLPRMSHSPRGGIQFDVSHPQDFSQSFISAARAAKNGSNTRDQVPRIEWLGKVIISADFQSNNPIDRLAACGQKKNWRARRIAQLA